MKRYASVIGLTLGVVLLLGLGYYLRYRVVDGTGAVDPVTGLPATDVDFSNSGGNEGAGPPSGLSADSFAVMIDAPVEAFYISPADEIFYLDPSGKVIRSKGGSTDILSASLLEKISFAEFSFNGKRLLVGYGAKETQWSVFDMEKKTWRPLEGDILSAAWSPSDSRIMYMDGTGINSIDMASARPRAQIVQRISLADVDLAWPSPNSLILGEHPSSEAPASILILDLKTKNVTDLGQYPAFSGTWNFGMSHGVAFRGTSRGKGGTFHELTARGEKQFSFLTLPSKCVFFEEVVAIATTSPRSATSTKKQQLACAVPRNQDELGREALPDSYLQRALFTNDDLYKIDLASGKLEPLILQAGTSFDADMLRAQNGRIFFRNRLDGKVYSVKN